MRTLGIAAVFALALAPLFAQSTPAIPPLPRQAPEIKIVEPDAKGNPVKTTTLSSYKGKVVVLAMIQTTCPHCQKECEMLSNLYSELKPKGVQMLAIAVNDNARMLVPAFVREHAVLFPVGSGSPDEVPTFLGFSVMVRWVVPQVAVIDRKGMIRAQTGPEGDANLQDAGYLRNLLTKLASEPGAPATTKAAPKAAPKSAAAKTTSN